MIKVSLSKKATHKMPNLAKKMGFFRKNAHFSPIFQLFGGFADRDPLERKPRGQRQNTAISAPRRSKKDTFVADTPGPTGEAGTYSGAGT
jgi:hypothetical protein